jgi:tetratricopeptide (TPR) repeat protein
MQLRARSVALLAVVAASSVSPAAGQPAPNPWVGLKVVTRPGASLHEGNVVVDDGKVQRAYTVGKTNGPWLWVESGPVAGWVRYDQVLTLDQAPGYLAGLGRTSQAAWAYGVRGLDRLEKNEPDTAIGDLDEALRLDPGQAWLWGSRGAALAAKGSYDSAVADLDQAIKLDPKDAKHFADRGGVWSRRGDFDKALADLDEAVRLDPNSAVAYCGRGVVGVHRREYDRAVADLGEAIRLYPTHARAYAYRGYARHRLGDLDGAVADYGEAVRLEPKRSWNYCCRGLARLSKGECDQAVADFDEAMRLAPEQAWPYYHRGRAWLGKGDYVKAVSDLDEAIRLDPSDAGAFNSLAWLLATCPDEGCRDAQVAVGAATRACELSGWKNAFHLGTLAAAYAEAGEFEKAIDFQLRANKLYDDGDEWEQGQQRLSLYDRMRPYRDEGRTGTTSVTQDSPELPTDRRALAR